MHDFHSHPSKRTGHATRNRLAAGALGVLLLTTAALSLPQDGRAGRRGQGAPRGEGSAARGERIEAFRKALAENKTSLVEAITLAEADRKGTAISAQMRLGKDGKLMIPVEVVVDDKPVEVIVDPETKKVITPVKPDRPSGGAGGGESGRQGGDEAGGERETDGG
jgi:hypothetical protein